MRRCYIVSDFFTDPDTEKEMTENFEEYLLYLTEMDEIVSNRSAFATAMKDFYFDGNLTTNLMYNITKVSSQRGE